MKEIVTDLQAEQESLDKFVSSLAEKDWDRMTLAEGWTIRDSISHIAHIDEVAVMAIHGDNTPFELAFKIGMAFNEEGPKKGRSMKVSDLLKWWKGAREIMYAELIKLDPKARIPWFALPMSARAFATARLMETWAHGIDCYDAMGVSPLDTDRLRHVAFLGYQARPYAYSVHGFPAPDKPIRLELTLPSGKMWIQGPEGAGDLIRGSAGDFCRVAVRRRHWRDTALEIRGSEALRFIEIAQTYAGPAGSGRAPGQIT